MEFVVHRIKEIAKLYSGGDAPEILSDVRTKECCVPVFSNGLSQEGLYGYTNKAQIFENAITISARGTIGAVFYRREPFLPIVRLISLIPNTKLVSTDFLYYYLKSIHIDGFGTSQQQLTIPFLGKKKIRIIKDIPTQKKIASILSTYDDLIEKNNRKIAILQEMAEELYKEWFVRFRFPGYKTAKFKDGIPDDWETKPLSEWLVDDFNGGWGNEVLTQKTPYEAFVIRGTDIEDVKKAIIDNVPCRFHKSNDINTKLLKEYDVVLELSNGNINNIGRTLFIDKQILGWFDKVMCASFCKTLRFKDKRTAFLIWQYINYLQNSGLMSYYKNTGANGINNFNFKRFLKMQISVPRHLDCVDDLMRYYNIISLLNGANYYLRKQRDLLLPRLMSGKLEVKA